jgi:hypothetical protein
MSIQKGCLRLLFRGLDKENAEMELLCIANCTAKLAASLPPVYFFLVIRRENLTEDFFRLPNFLFGGQFILANAL